MKRPGRFVDSSMFRYIVSILLTALLSFVLGLYLPWWTVAIAAFAVSLLIPQKPVMSFLAGFLGVFLLLEILAWWIGTKNKNILFHKIATVLPLGGSTLLLIFITSLVGSLVAGFAALTACYTRKKK